jgi:1-acyl-sn-glycerol-3-phosphate acyltransferase
VRSSVADESRSETVARRLRTIPSLLVAFLLVTVLLPAFVLIGLAIDAARRVAFGVPPTAARLALFLWTYLAAEVGGLAALAAIWLWAPTARRRPRLLEGTWRLQQLWAHLLFGAAQTLFGLRVVVSGADVVTPGPAIVLVRHTSIVDTLLPANLLARPHGIHLRYVLKRELLSDPCLDVAGRRLPNYFVRRGTGEPQELERVRRLTDGLGPRDGVLIYPEGTRFSPERRVRAIARISERDPRLAQRAERLRQVLPPRLGGVGALLDGAPQADVVVMAHHGFEGLRRISDVWRGGLVGLTLRVRLSRVPRASIPEDRAARSDWLFDLWEEVDEWVASASRSDR